MLLLHLSDIHFRAREFGTAQDPYAGIRANLVGDIEAQFVERGEAPQRILISGDIAYSGAAEEYEFAAQWIDELCDRLGLPHDAVFVIPGNHDVDQAISETVPVKSVRKFVKEKGEGSRQETIRKVLSEEQSREILYSPIEAYNDFAVRYSCRLTPPNETVAREYLDLHDGWKLRLIGLNSALLSGRGDAKGSLLVDNASHGITSELGSVTLLMCHHPYGWLEDGDELQDTVNSVAPLQLFGHEHTIRPEMGEDFVRLRTAAVNPEIDEGEWKPGYNILEFAVEEVDNAWQLEVKVYARIWQNTPPQFVPIFSARRQPVFERKIPLENPPTAEMRRVALTTAKDTIVIASQDQIVAVAQQEPTLSMRALTLRFFDLSYPQQSTIVAELGLNDENDANKAASVRFSNALKKAKDCGMQGSLLQAIIKQESD